MHSKGKVPSDTQLCASSGCRTAVPCRLVLGSFFLFDRLLGLYSSLRLEGMARISFYHTVVFLQGLCLVGWFYWQASMPHYPSLSSLHRAAVRPLESTALSAQGWDCSFTTGSARKQEDSQQRQGWPVPGENTITDPTFFHSEIETQATRKSGSGGQQKLQTLRNDQGEMLSQSTRIPLQSTSSTAKTKGKERQRNTHFPLFKISTDFLMCCFSLNTNIISNSHFVKVCAIDNKHFGGKGE